MQQPQVSNGAQLNGRPSNYNFTSTPTISAINSSSNSVSESNKNYVSKNYEPSSLIDYNQPTRQSSSLPTNGLMTNLSQPLYSQAVYETRATPSTSSLNDSPVGSVVGLDLKSGPRSNTSGINAVHSLASTLNYMPQLLASSHQNLQTFTSMIGQQNQNQGIRLVPTFLYSMNNNSALQRICY
jgi:hypothetical protein